MQRLILGNTFIAAQFSTVKLWNQPRYPSMSERIKEMWHTHTMEFYSATNKNEKIALAGKWMDVETIMLNKIS